MSKISRRKALSIIGGGLLLGATGSNAYNNVNADRGVDLNTTDGSSMIGINISDIYYNCGGPNSGGKGRGKGKGSGYKIAEITNNIDEIVNIEIYITEDNMNGITIKGKNKTTLRPNQSEEFYVKIPCKGKPQSIEFGVISNSSTLDLEAIRRANVI